jgi:hypothetical protein
MYGTKRKRDDQLRKMQETYLKNSQAELISFQGVAGILGHAEDPRRVEM